MWESRATASFDCFIPVFAIRSRPCRRPAAHPTGLGTVGRMLLVASLVVIASAANAVEGLGYGATADEARRNAAADLVSMLRVQVQSVVESCKRVSGNSVEDCGSRVLKRTAADLPLLGLRYAAVGGGTERHGAKAVLEPATSLPLYRRRLADLMAEFTAGRRALEATRDGRLRHELLSRQIVTVRQITDHRVVAVALGAPGDEAPIAETDLASELAGLEQSADSIEFAARLLMKGVTGRLAQVGTIVPAMSRMGTPFGDALAVALRKESPTDGPALAAKADYRILDDGRIDVMLELRRVADGALVAVQTARLVATAYAGYRATPLAQDFDRLLEEGVVLSGDLRVDITTHQGGSDLLFHAGESVRVLVRVNRPGHFYIVGHVVREDGRRFSYVLPLDGEPGGEGRRERFLKYVPPDQVNHLIDLGEFEVIAPFGAEHVQVFAATREKDLVLPQTRFDAELGYHVIVGAGRVADPVQAVQTTRGIVPKVSGKSMASEATLSFATAPQPVP